MTLTNVISISYGGSEADLPVSYQRRQCNEFMKLGLQGTSVVLASGDSGVAGPAGDGNADGCLGTGEIFSPGFPSTCSYITTVGSTTLPASASVQNDAETATTRFPSGGGFSNIYATPDYQKTAVSNYLTNNPPPYPSYTTTDDAAIGAGGGIYNRGGRGYPDVSAVGDNIVVFNKVAPTLIGGTSASAPIFASLLNRINEERIAAGKFTVGFVNPTLVRFPLLFPLTGFLTHYSTHIPIYSTISPLDPTLVAIPTVSQLLRVGTQSRVLERPTTPLC